MIQFLKRLFGGSSSNDSSYQSVSRNNVWDDSENSPEITGWNQVGETTSNHHQGKVVYDVNNIPQYCGNFVNSGGEGGVYELAAKPSYLIKIYNKSGIRNSQKVLLMLEKEGLKSNKQFAWPEVSLYDENHAFIGFAMQKKEGLDLNTLANPMAVRDFLPHWDRNHLVKAALSFVRGLKSLHAQEIFVGDINPGNLLVNPKSAKVTFIDCDSYQIKHGSEIHLCEVGMPQFTAPELHNKDWKTTPRTERDEVFAAAMLLYRIFMFGAHPYSRINGDSPVANLKSGKCPLGTGSGCRFPKGNWYNYWSHLPYKMKDLFIRTFRDGHSEPHLRPELVEFEDALKAYAVELKKGYHSLEIMPSYPKKSKYFAAS